MKILLLGCGNMGAAIISGFAQKHPKVAVMAVDPSVEQAKTRLAGINSAEVVADKAEAEGWSPDIVLLAVKPQQFETGLCLPEWTNALVVSVMAGVTLETITGTLDTERVVRVMPNLLAVISQGMSIGLASPAASVEDRDAVAQIFEAVGDFAWVETEPQIDYCTAVNGSGPGYVFAFAEHLESAARDAGVPESIFRKLVAQTLIGAAAMLAKGEKTAAELKQMVSNKGGTTLAGLDVLEAPDAMPRLLKDAVAAAAERAKELSIC